jgi:hypothetical protein
VSKNNYYYDPRIDSYVVNTNNPILILADIMINAGFVDHTEKGKFWSQIGYLANCSDEKVNGNGHKPKRIKLNTKIKFKLNEKKLIRKKKLNEQKALVRQRILQNKET